MIFSIFHVFHDFQVFLYFCWLISWPNRLWGLIIWTLFSQENKKFHHPRFGYHENVSSKSSTQQSVALRRESASETLSGVSRHSAECSTLSCKFHGILTKDGEIFYFTIQNSVQIINPRSLFAELISKKKVTGTWTLRFIDTCIPCFHTVSCLFGTINTIFERSDPQNHPVA